MRSPLDVLYRRHIKDKRWKDTNMNTALVTKSPATEAQVNFLHSLFDQKFDADKAATCHEWLNNHRLSKATASAKISELKEMADVKGEELDLGMYQVDGVIYKVQRAVHGSGFLYAKRWDEEAQSFEKETGAIRKIRASHRMTLEEAARFGQITGTCGHCGRTLTDEDSIAAGIGPVCAGKYN